MRLHHRIRMTGRTFGRYDQTTAFGSAAVNSFDNVYKLQIMRLWRWFLMCMNTHLLLVIHRPITFLFSVLIGWVV